ncbi:hypothetical protein QBC37DRAFT_292564 [Rhypophila decipiens]|uniref:LysM domain-containing protein n=1 Tax=Rhypophila decipiens TaxID=261697 RepID=A0AAN6Y1L8_9PEZI|nr:hypothetical protein QBC37DRAFT_292564 [Rhypophila decipiens]
MSLALYCPRSWRLATIRFLCVLIAGQTALAAQFLSNDTAPENLSAGCLSVLTADISSCNALVGQFWTGYYYDQSMLIDSCTSQCETALATYESSVVSACGGDTWSGYDDEGDESLALIPSIMRYNYALTCLQDSGRWCNVVAGIAARIADPGDSRGNFLPDVVANGTAAPSECDLCFVKALRMQAAVPYFDGPALVSASIYESKTASCSIANMPRTTSTIPVTITTAPLPTETPSCDGTTYTIQAGDTCQSISLAQGIGTAWLLMDNSLPAWCDKFPTSGTLCLENKCEVVTVPANATCHSIAKSANITEVQLKAWNVVLNAGCYNIEKMEGYQLCVSPPGDEYIDPTPPEPVTTPAPAPTDLAEGTNPRCARFYQVQPDEYCNLIVMRFGISLPDFYFLNPGINKNCTNLFALESYCVEPFGDINTYSGRPGATPTVTPSIPFTTLTPISTAPTSTGPIADLPTPLPLALESLDDCFLYFNGSSIQDATVLTDTDWDNLCQYAAALFSVSDTELALWNPSLPNITSSSCTFDTAFRYCGRRYEQDPLTGPTDKGVEFPVRDGAIESCLQWGDVPSDWVCDDVLFYFELTIAQFYEYNPEVGADCSGLWTEMAYCIRDANYTSPSITTTSSAASTTTTSTTGPPGPTHTGQPPSCNKWHVVVADDTCSTVATEYGLTTSQFLALNPAVSADCSTNFWLGSAYCVGTSQTTTTTTTATSTSTTSTPATNGTSSAVTVPSPVQEGNAIMGCSAYAQAQSGDWCSAFAERNEISLGELYTWNSVLAAEGGCDTGFWSGYWYCVGF